MPHAHCAPILAGLLAVGILGAGTETQAQYQRRTPIVEAVQKTRQGIVSLKVQRTGSHKDVVGTGVIVDERGMIVTNRHVIVSAGRIIVRLADGTELAGHVVVEDDAHDLAVVRINAGKRLQALALGPASDLMVGETVIAVGNPFGYTNTVSTGIVSALGREITMPTGETIGNLIQTSASINPGNSGGPLLNINSEVIGINIALRDGAQGIAFALNADTVQHLLSEHLSALKISGVAHGLACKERAAEEGEARQRVVVEEAATGGLKPGDEILRVGDRTVANRFDVERALWDYKPDDTVQVAVRRAGKEMVVALRLTRGEETAAAARGPARTQARSPGAAQAAER
jgi:serine protease Do